MNLLRSFWLALALVPCLAFGEPIDLNTADAATLARELKGIGDVRARAIIDHRTRNGPFRSVDELALVKGIGPKVIETNRAKIRVERKPPAPRTVPAQGPARR